MTIASTCARLLAKWRAEGLARAAAVSDGDLKLLETQLGVHIPEELAEYFRLVHGMAENVTDGSLFHFCNVGELVEWSRAVDPKTPVGHVVFADYSMWAHGYGIDIQRHTVELMGGDSPKTVASSLEEFLDLYVKGDASLFG